MLKPVTSYIYHRPPMLLVDSIIHANSEIVQSKTTISADNLFLDKEKNYVPSWVGIEILAQTAGIWVGMEDELRGDLPSLGFLLGSRNFEAFTYGFNVGTEVTTTIRPTFVHDMTVIFEGEITDGSGTILASGELTAFRPEDPDVYLRGEKV